MLQWMASCGIAVMIVSVGLLCADDFDDYVWHCCDHCCWIPARLLMRLCAIAVGLLWNCLGFAV